MKKLLLGLTAAMLFCAAGDVHAAGHHRYAQLKRQGEWFNANYQWHQNYNHVQWGQPIALITPPHAGFQSHYSWGVARTRMTPIYPQFARPYAGPVPEQSGTRLRIGPAAPISLVCIISVDRGSPRPASPDDSLGGTGRGAPRQRFEALAQVLGNQSNCHLLNEPIQQRDDLAVISS